MLSDKEQELLNFIKERKGVTIKEIQEGLGDKSVGGIGKLVQSGDIEKIKIREGEGYNIKSVTKYVLVEKSDGSEES